MTKTKVIGKCLHCNNNIIVDLKAITELMKDVEQTHRCI